MRLPGSGESGEAGGDAASGRVARAHRPAGARPGGIPILRGLERFGETAIQKDRPMAVIEEAFVPLYLHHRYAVDSAVTVLGGQAYIYAMRGDGRTPVRWAPAVAQRQAIDALMSALKLNELTLPSSLLGQIPPRRQASGALASYFRA
jgi:hypothetical protein